MIWKMTYFKIKYLAIILFWMLDPLKSDAAIDECCKIIEIYNEDSTSDQENVAGLYELQPKKIPVNVIGLGELKSNWYLNEGENVNKRILYSDSFGWSLVEFDAKNKKFIPHIRLDSPDRCISPTLNSNWQNWNPNYATYKGAGFRKLKIRCGTREELRAKK